MIIEVVTLTNIPEGGGGGNVQFPYYRVPCWWIETDYPKNSS